MPFKSIRLGSVILKSFKFLFSPRRGKTVRFFGLEILRLFKFVKADKSFKLVKSQPVISKLSVKPKLSTNAIFKLLSESVPEPSEDNITFLTFTALFKILVSVS